MKITPNIFYYLLILLMIACSDQRNDSKLKTKKNEPIKKQQLVLKGPSVKLKYKFFPGMKFSYKLQTISNNTEIISADTTIKNEINKDATYTFSFNVKDIEPNDIASLSVKISSIIAETKFNGQSIKYNSKMLYSTRERMQFIDYEAVKNIPFRIKVNNLGQVIEVSNVNKILKNILDIQKMPDTLSSKSKEQMRNTIANGTLMPLTQQIFKVVVAKEVSVDSVWQLKYNTPLAVFDVENNSISKISDIIIDKDTLVSISSSLFINVKGDNVAQDNGMTYTFEKPILNAEGESKFNLTKGLVEYSESNTILEMSMTVEGFDNKQQPVKTTKKDISNNTNIVELLR